MSDTQAGAATRAELAQSARKHYEKLANECHDWLNTIEHAIDVWEQEPERVKQFAAVVAERNKLKAQVEHYTEQARQNGYRAAAAEAEIERLESVCRLVANEVKRLEPYCGGSTTARVNIKNLVIDLENYGRRPGVLPFSIRSKDRVKRLLEELPEMGPEYDNAGPPEA